MKKIFVFWGLIIGASLLSACTGIEEEFKADPKLVSYSGFLSEQKNTDSEPGSHFLVTDDKKGLPLRSLTINLSSDDYLGNKVQITAILNDKENVLEVTGISVLEILSEKTEKKRFVEYRNTGIGLRLKYYDNWILEEADAVVFKAPRGEESSKQAVVKFEKLEFNYQPKIGAVGLEDSPLRAYYRENFGGPTDQDVFHKIGVDKVDGMQFISDRVITYVLYRPGFVYRITFTPADPGDPEDEMHFNQMMSEFRFIAFDALDDSDSREDDSMEKSSLPELDMKLTDFESLPYSFAGKYPAKWYYAGMKGGEDSVLHHYGFSDKSLTEDNEIIGLDVLAISIPGGTKMTIGDRDFVVVHSGDLFRVYVTVNGQNYLVKGPVEYKDLILVMAAGIESVDEEPLKNSKGISL